MRRIVDFSQYEHVVASSHREYVVVQPLTGWRSRRLVRPLDDAFRDDLAAVSEAIGHTAAEDRWEMARLEAVRSFRDPLDYVDPFGDLDRGNLSPIGVLHHFRLDEFELDRVVGPSVGTVSVAAGGHVELVDGTNDAAAGSQDAATSGRTWVVPRSGAAASFDLVAMRVAARAHLHRFVRRSVPTAPAPRVEVVEVDAGRAPGATLHNPGTTMATFDLRRVVARTALQLRDAGASLCWQVTVPAGDDADDSWDPMRAVAADLLAAGVPSPADASVEAVAALLQTLFDTEHVHVLAAGPASARVVVPIRPGREHTALTWLQRLHVEGTDGLDDPYEPTAYERAMLGRGRAAMTVGAALERFCDLVEQWNTEVLVDGEVAATAGNGYRHLDGGFRAQPSSAASEVFDEWIECRPTDCFVPIELALAPDFDRTPVVAWTRSELAAGA